MFLSNNRNRFFSSRTMDAEIHKSPFNIPKIRSFGISFFGFLSRATNGAHKRNRNSKYKQKYNAIKWIKNASSLLWRKGICMNHKNHLSLFFIPNQHCNDFTKSDNEKIIYSLLRLSLKTPQ